MTLLSGGHDSYSRFNILSNFLLKFVTPTERFIAAQGFFSRIATLRYVMQKVGAVAQSVERATPGEEVPGSIPPVAARSLLAGSVSV